MPLPPKQNIFLTGASGFLGKVILENLLRRKNELNIEKIFLLIRNKKGISAQERFHASLAQSPCFKNHTTDWRDLIEVVEGDTTKNFCGLSEKDEQKLASCVTHIINSAASVRFDLPIAEAALQNIEGPLNLLRIAQKWKKLQCFLQVSTAYVHTHQNGAPLAEKLVQLPRSAGAIYGSILSKKISEKKLLAETNYPNTYTLTKCIAEHLLTERKGTIPLRIVRPSVIGPAWKSPFPGWVDSYTAISGGLALIGAGYLQAAVIVKGCKLDVVPVDFVSEQIVNESFNCNTSSIAPLKIVQTVMGIEKAYPLNKVEKDAEVFKKYCNIKTSNCKFFESEKGFSYHLHRFAKETVPLFVAQSIAGLKGNNKLEKRIGSLRVKLKEFNSTFATFTKYTFNFKSGLGNLDSNFDIDKYGHLMCEGVSSCLLGGNKHEVLMAGKKYLGSKGSFLSETTNPIQGATKTTRLLTPFLGRLSKSFFDQITFNRASFENTFAELPKNPRLLLIPTHRSYLDFLVWSYLFHTHQDLGISVPRIAAAIEFSKLPLLGKIFANSGAFYIRRGMGRQEKIHLDAAIQRMTEHNIPIEFFIEGTRSRSGRYLPPRVGLLRSLQKTGHEFHIIPLALTMDRIPEQQIFVDELRNNKKNKMSTQKLLKWLAANIFSSSTHFGRVHMECGHPFKMDSTTDVNLLSRNIMGDLQATTPVSTYHLKCFLHHTGLENDLGLEWLSNELKMRGAHLIQSPLTPDHTADSDVEKWMRTHWIHWFLPDALKAYPDSWAIKNHFLSNYYMNSSYISEENKHSYRYNNIHINKINILLKHAFEPVMHDYHVSLNYLSHHNGNSTILDPKEITKEFPEVYMPNVQEVCESLLKEGFLSQAVKGCYLLNNSAQGLKQIPYTLLQK